MRGDCAVKKTRSRCPRPEALEALPNVGPTCAARLHAAGIRTPADLARAGAVGAALAIARLRPADPPCRSMLSGLEGAIRGVRWHAIPGTEREALWREYQARLGAGKGGARRA